jgi:hypothetical protein
MSAAKSEKSGWKEMPKWCKVRKMRLVDDANALNLKAFAKIAQYLVDSCLNVGIVSVI